MNRRFILNLISLSPLALISSKIPTGKPIVSNLIKRWKSSKDYTIAILEAMPADRFEYRPSEEQLSFAQHFLHIGFTNNSFIGILMDTKTYTDFDAMMKSQFFLERPDPISLFQPDNLVKRDLKKNKKLVSKYVVDTFDYVISSLNEISDDTLTKGENKEKPWYLEGHTNLDLILRSETHTAHHRAQAICYLRMNGIRPPGYSKNNTF